MGLTNKKVPPFNYEHTKQTNCTSTEWHTKSSLFLLSMAIGILSVIKEQHILYYFIFLNVFLLTLCSRMVNLIKYPLMPGQLKFFECSTP
jgi:hypothetical protein